MGEVKDPIENKENAIPTKPSKFKIERLRQDCLKLFGVTQSTFDGAMFGKTGEFAIDEIKKTIDAWQKTSVKTKDKKEKEEAK